MTFSLLPFQDVVIGQLSEVTAEWQQALASGMSPRYGRQPIPLILQLEAITGAGKTPVLASLLGALGPSIVFWTTKSKILTEQTIAKLNGVYRPLLPDGVRILPQVPSPGDWRDLLSDQLGTTIWVRTVASWNRGVGGESNSDDARLSLHRPQEWAGDRSPWTHLADRHERQRPLWIIYDESQGQTDVQLDQLLDLTPFGIATASGTPVISQTMSEMLRTLQRDDVFGPLAMKAKVSIPTSQVVNAGLLKTTIRIADIDIDDDLTKVKTVVDRWRLLDAASVGERVSVRPRALYVVERSNERQGDSRPLILWRLLKELGVPQSEIAVATNTNDLPPDAEKIAFLASLTSRHRHIIFNKKLEEGWDDPEAYIAYFDGTTKSDRRIKQLIGRVLRQPGAEHFGAAPLNTAHLFVNAPNERFDAIVKSIQQSLVESHGADEFGEPTIRVITDADLSEEIPLREEAPAPSLPTWLLAWGAGIEVVRDRLRLTGEMVYPDDALVAPGEIRERIIDLTADDVEIVREAQEIGENMKRPNRDYLVDRVAAISAQARKAISTRDLEGPMWSQRSSVNSPAQTELRDLAKWAVEELINHVRYRHAVDPRATRWSPKPWMPRAGAPLRFRRSIHASYVDRQSLFNLDEREFAEALDRVEDGWWIRNFSTAAHNGYGVPLPLAVGSSNSFFPDFLWWVGKSAFAIETSGQFIVEPKVHGKLVGIDEPRIVLAVRGRISGDWHRTEDKSGWTLVRQTNVGTPRPEHFADADILLRALREG